MLNFQTKGLVEQCAGQVGAPAKQPNRVVPFLDIRSLNNLAVLLPMLTILLS